MITTPSVNSQLPLPTEEAGSQKRVAGFADKTAARAAEPEKGPAAFADFVYSNNTIGDLQTARDGLNTVAANIRSSDNALQYINGQVGKMKDALEGIVKNYPPFPPGSTERAEMLQSFNGIRNQISRLTLPAEKFGLEDIATGQSDIAGATEIIHQVGASDVPSLPGDASDEEIYRTLQQLHGVTKNIADQRAALAHEVEKIKTTIGKTTTTPPQYTELKGEATQIETESAAEGISIEARKSFAETRGISREHSSQLAQLLR